MEPIRVGYETCWVCGHKFPVVYTAEEERKPAKLVNAYCPKCRHVSRISIQWLIDRTPKKTIS